MEGRDRFLILHGMVTEYIQTFVEGRFGSWKDVGINTTGIMLGLLLYWVVRRRSG